LVLFRKVFDVFILHYVYTCIYCSTREFVEQKKRNTLSIIIQALKIEIGKDEMCVPPILQSHA